MVASLSLPIEEPIRGRECWPTNALRPHIFSFEACLLLTSGIVCQPHRRVSRESTKGDAFLLGPFLKTRKPQCLTSQVVSPGREIYFQSKSIADINQSTSELERGTVG